MTKQQIEAEKKRDGLLLHRTRVVRDLSTCTGERYRKTLEDGLKHLDAELAALGWTP